MYRYKGMTQQYERESTIPNKELHNHSDLPQ